MSAEDVTTCQLYAVEQVHSVALSYSTVDNLILTLGCMKVITLGKHYVARKHWIITGFIWMWLETMWMVLPWVKIQKPI